MNLNLLKIFHTVAERLNFTRAAEELHLTQPGISKHIATLEEHYGVRLFDRLGRRVMLTQAGDILHTATTSIFAQLEQSRSRIDDLKGLTGGKLDIGASVTIAAYIIPGMLTTFRKKAPAVEITVETAFSRHIAERVLDNTLEMGFVGHYTSDPRLEIRSFMKDPMVLVVSPRHPWAQRKSPVRLTELAGQTFLLSKQGSGTWRLVSKHFENAGIVLKHIMELGTTEGVKQGVAADLGISIVSRHVLGAEFSGGMLREIPLAGEGLERELFLVYRKDRYLSQAARAFLELFTLFPELPAREGA
ncbi:LysR family transcriptional regulator [Geobacter sp. SVR]|uniref:LysR family transcriptional regulator n=1 Tax=Geobacter sp. SVR TaxID=2495594 RepID=UPI001563F121|nr:LysR family transcriptional regulator [Geobacter sp. SVR]